MEIRGRSVPVAHTDRGTRALLGGQIVAPAGVQRYLERAFGPALRRVEREMQRLAESYDPDALATAAYGLYERFRPLIPAGRRGWGARGELDLHVIRDLRPPKARRDRRRAPAPAGDATSWTKEHSMGQRKNSGRQASLDEAKERAAGRGGQRVREQVRDAKQEQFAKGKTAGATGRAGVANRPPRRAATGLDTVGRSTKPARKR